MKLTLATRAFGIAAVAAVAATACGSNSNGTNAQPVSGSSSSPSACASGSLTGQGSTFQQNMEKQWTSQYAQQCSGAQITYTGTGSGAGIQQFGSGTVDFAGSDVTMKPDEQATADKRCNGTAIAFPITAGGIAIIYHLKNVSSLNLSAKTLAGIFQGTIKTWDNAAIKADNPGVTLPSTPVKSFHRADGSGTTSVFSAFEAAVAGSDWKLGSDKTLNWPAGQAAKGSDGVTAGVKQTDGGITYAEVSFAKLNNLPTAKIKGMAGGFADLTGSNVSDAINSGFTVTGTGNNVSGKLDFTKMTGYPISTVSYAIVCQKYADAGKAKLISNYFQYVVTTGQQGADQLGFAPLPQTLVDKSKAAAASVTG